MWYFFLNAVCVESSKGKGAQPSITQNARSPERSKRKLKKTESIDEHSGGRHEAKINDKVTERKSEKEKRNLPKDKEEGMRSMRKRDRLERDSDDDSDSDGEDEEALLIGMEDDSHQNEPPSKVRKAWDVLAFSICFFCREKSWEINQV